LGSILFTIGGCYWFGLFISFSIVTGDFISAIFAILPGGVIAIVFGYVAFVTWKKNEE
jgi:hypothetical protein